MRRQLVSSGVQSLTVFVEESMRLTMMSTGGKEESERGREWDGMNEGEKEGTVKRVEGMREMKSRE